jgi:uncharacterized protein YjgD (DUF1641 family)
VIKLAEFGTASNKELQEQMKIVQAQIKAIKSPEALRQLEKTLDELTKSKTIKAIKGTTQMFKGMAKASVKGFIIQQFIKLLEPLMILLELFTPILDVLGAIILSTFVPVIKWLGPAIGEFAKWLWEIKDILALFLSPVTQIQVIIVAIIIAIQVLVSVYENVLVPAWNGFIFILKVIGNAIAMFINFIIGLINLIPFVNIPTIPLFPLAEGGIVTSPTLAMIGEAGPEAVIPLNGGMGGGRTESLLEDILDAQNETLRLKRKSKMGLQRRRVG